MKKKLLLSGFILLIIIANMNAQDTLIGWSFPTGTKTDSLPDKGLTMNINKPIHLKSDTAIQYGNYGRLSAQAKGLSNGTALEKGWVIQLNTTGYDHLKLYSKQCACPMHSGPKYYKVQYMIPSANWIDVANGSVVLGLGWPPTHGVINGLDLPAACNDASVVNIRWVMTSDSNVPGSTMGTVMVSDGSMSRIDDIFITGQLKTGITDEVKNHVSIYPNPNDGLFLVETPVAPQLISVYNTLGKLVYENNNPGVTNSIDLGNSGQGVYIIRIKDIQQTTINKIIIK